MEGRILLNFGSAQRITVFKRKYRLVLGAVILIHAANVFPQRNSPDEQKEEDEANAAVDEVEGDASAERWIEFLEFRRSQQWQILVHEDEEGK